MDKIEIRPAVKADAAPGAGWFHWKVTSSDEHFMDPIESNTPTREAAETAALAAGAQFGYTEADLPTTS